jgi:DNA primase/energy-coupling factor transporter ATP-binding protein EcfA2
MEIPEIKAQLPLSRVLQHYGLKPDRHGRLHCPFHDDSTPSLQMYEKTNTVYCFSTNCPTHGRSLDVIDLVMYKENCTKHEAIEKCKQLIGGEAAPPPPAEPLTRTAVLTKMFTYFKNAVYNSKPAQEYLRSRALDPSTLEIGYNTGQFHHGTRRDELLIKSCLDVGLLSRHDRPGRTGADAYRPFAKYGLVFALRSQANQVAGLYFRSTVNDSDQRHFYLKDRQGLYPRYPAPDTQKLILTESVIDAATLLQLPAITGSYSVLALYGTNGLTEEHEQAIRELSQLEEIIFWLNADAPGEEATKKHATTLQALHPAVRITQVYLPAGEDINSLAQTHIDPGIFTDLLEARSAPGAKGAKLFLSIEKSAEKKKHREVPSQPVKPAASTGDLDTTNPYKLRYSTDCAHYHIQGSLPKSLDTLKVMLVIEHPGTGQKARNRVDLYEDKAVERLGQEVSDRLPLRRDLLQADLYRLTDLVEQYREEVLLRTDKNTDKPLPALTVRERQELEGFAKKPRLIKRLNELLGQAGIVGEERNRIFLLLIAISHKMPETLHGLLQGSSGSGKTRLLRQISDCMPPESVTRLTRLSDKVLYNFPEHYFVNRLLCLEDIDGLSEEAEFAFRELQSNGELNSATSVKLESGQITSGQKTVRGPIASLACTTRGEIYEDNMSRVFLIAVDESPEQTARIIDYQNRKAAGLIDGRREQEIKTFLQNFVRILQPCEVVNPYASRIHLPPEAHKIRRLNDLLQSFVKMVTILNQYQRKRDDRQRLISEVEDIETAVAVLLDSIVLKVDELDGSLRQFYEQLKGYLKQQHNGHHQHAGFSLREVRQALKLSKTQLFRYAADLVQLEYIHASGGYANRGYTYQVAYWDNYTGLRERVRRSLEEQVKALKAGTPAPENPKAGTPRNASGTLEPA